jgi:hypothetical protein
MHPNLVLQIFTTWRQTAKAAFLAGGHFLPKNKTKSSKTTKQTTKVPIN